MAEKTDIPARIKRAVADRRRHADWIDETLRLAMPTYRRIEDSTTADDRNFEQDDLFDTTLQTTVEDFASDMISTFTPRHDRWVLFEPAEDLSEGERAYIRPQLQQIGNAVFAEIERSNYWEAAQECFAFWAVSAMGVAVSDMGPLNPLHFQPIEIPDLVLERGPDGSIHGRWRQMKLTKAEQRAMFGAMFGDAFPAPGRERDSKQTVYEGCDRDWSTPGVERWHYRIIVNGEQRVLRTYESAGSCPIIVCPFRQQSDSAWGPGPAHKATPLARVLDELAYLNLKALQKSVDPPYSHEEDGMSNYDAGVEAGKWYARAPGSSAPEPLMADMRFDASFFQADLMRQAIKRALYQDRPEQPGMTPPTATQWADELAWNTRRKELPRDRCVREWVLPIIERVAWIKAQRGELPEVKLKGGRVVNVRPVSPLSKAKDLEDMNLTGQVLGLTQLVGQAKSQGVPVNVLATTENLIRTARERHIVMMTEEEIAAEMAAAAAANGGMDVSAA
jgi:hypothetical protein